MLRNAEREAAWIREQRGIASFVQNSARRGVAASLSYCINVRVVLIETTFDASNTLFGGVDISFPLE